MQKMWQKPWKLHAQELVDRIIPKTYQKNNFLMISIPSKEDTSLFGHTCSRCHATWLCYGYYCFSFRWTGRQITNNESLQVLRAMSINCSLLRDQNVRDIFNSTQKAEKAQIYDSHTQADAYTSDARTHVHTHKNTHAHTLTHTSRKILLTFCYSVFGLSVLWFVHYCAKACKPDSIE